MGLLSSFNGEKIVPTYDRDLHPISSDESLLALLTPMTATKVTVGFKNEIKHFRFTMPRFWSFFLLSVALLAGVAESGNILFFGPFVSKSMIITYTPILKELASHGHKVHPC